PTFLLVLLGDQVPPVEMGNGPILVPTCLFQNVYFPTKRPADTAILVPKVVSGLIDIRAQGPNGRPGPRRAGQFGPDLYLSVGKGKLRAHPGRGIGLGGSDIGILLLQGLDLQGALAYDGAFGPVDIMLQFPIVPTAIVWGN